MRTPLEQHDTIQNLYLKREDLNPGGSTKDRIGEYIINTMITRGEVQPGGSIVECTTGNTGTALLLAARKYNIKVVLTVPDKVSKSKISMMRALGGEVIVTGTHPSDHPEAYNKVAERISKEQNIPWIDQYNNPLNTEAHYHNTGVELVEDIQEVFKKQGSSPINFVCGVGSGGTISGIGKRLNECFDPMDVWVEGVDPEGSIYTMPNDLGSYKVEGIGADYYPKAYDKNIVASWHTISDDTSYDYAKELYQDTGVFAGGSTGAVYAAAKTEAEEYPDRLFVMMVHDTGRGYLDSIYA